MKITSAYMEVACNEGQVDFVVPDVAAGAHDVSLETPVGGTTILLTVKP